MTKTVTRFQCEICEELYKTEQEAMECEAKGKELPLASKGDSIEYRVEMSGGFPDWFTPVRVLRVADEGHYLVYYFEEENEDGEWEESMHFNSVWGKEQFNKLCTLKDK